MEVVLPHTRPKQDPSTGHLKREKQAKMVLVWLCTQKSLIIKVLTTAGPRKKQAIGKQLSSHSNRRVKVHLLLLKTMS